MSQQRHRPRRRPHRPPYALKAASPSLPLPLPPPPSPPLPSRLLISRPRRSPRRVQSSSFSLLRVCEERIRPAPWRSSKTVCLAPLPFPALLPSPRRPSPRRPSPFRPSPFRPSSFRPSSALVSYASMPFDELMRSAAALCSRLVPATRSHAPPAAPPSPPPPPPPPRPSVTDKLSFPQEEEKTLAYWRDIDAFQTSVRMSEGRPEYTFYDGPPFATGLPHYGHLLAGSIKVAAPPPSHPRTLAPASAACRPPRLSAPDMGRRCATNVRCGCRTLSRGTPTSRASTSSAASDGTATGSPSSTRSTRSSASRSVRARPLLTLFPRCPNPSLIRCPFRRRTRLGI